MRQRLGWTYFSVGFSVDLNALSMHVMYVWVLALLSSCCNTVCAYRIVCVLHTERHTHT